MYATRSENISTEILPKLRTLGNLTALDPKNELPRARARAEIQDMVKKLNKVNAFDGFIVSMILAGIDGNITQCHEFYSKAKLLSPSDRNLHLNFAVALSLSSPLSLATSFLKESLLKFPGDTDFYQLLAEYLSEAGRFMEAIEVLESGDKLKSDYLKKDIKKYKRIVDFYKEYGISEESAYSFFEVIHNFLTQKGMISLPRAEGISSDGTTECFSCVISTVNMDIDLIMTLNDELIDELISAELPNQVETMFIARIR